jgi:hypothetical protein
MFNIKGGIKMEILAVIEDNRRRYLVFDDIPELTYQSFKPEREIETVEEGEIGEFKFSEDFSVPVVKKTPKRERVIKINEVEIDRNPAQNPYFGYDKLYIGTDKTETFVNCFKLELGSSGAFGGRTINIKMKDGTQKTFKGNLWDGGHQDAEKLLSTELIYVAADTRKSLKRCYVFTSFHLKKDKYQESLDNYQGKVWGYREYEKHLKEAKETIKSE